MAFEAGSIIGRLKLDKSGWDSSVQSVKKDEKKLKGFTERNAANFKRMGAAMTIAGTAILIGFSKIIKSASDAQEVSSKFGTVFQDVFKEASRASKELANNYGLSTTASKEMLSSTGDLLTGMGATGKQALELSLATQKLAVDLASFTNFSGGATGASQALTKAMLGERESLKSLGIVISEEAVKTKLLEKGQQDLTGSTLLQAKAFAVLELATEQSQNAIGDFSRTSEDLANQSRILGGNFRDMTDEIGKKLIPVVTSLVSKVSDIVVKITEWMQAHPGLTDVIVKLVAGVGALMAVLGPVLLIVPKLVSMFGKMKDTALKLIPSMKDLKGSVGGIKGALGNLAAIGAAAFVGWKIGRLIGELTGLDEVVQDVAESVIEKFGLWEGSGEMVEDRTKLIAKQQRMLAEATKIAGVQITSVVKANQILQGVLVKVDGKLVKASTSIKLVGKGTTDWAKILKKQGIPTVKECNIQKRG